jgi:hypothetical protein
MKKFLVTITCEKCVTFEVHANNELQALDIATDMDASKCLDIVEDNHEWTVKQINEEL